MTIKFLLLFLGLLLGYASQKHKKLNAVVAKLVFSFILPLVVIAEFSSVSLTDGFNFLWGSAFVLVLFYLGRLFGWSKRDSALLATAEGGTMGFVLYVLIGTEPISRFLLIDMLGNGLALFVFIYYQLTRKQELKTFVTNPLLIAMAIGLLLNAFGWHLLSFTAVATIETWLVYGLLLLVSMVVGSGLDLKISKEIVSSKFFLIFWLVRMVGVSASILLNWPLAITVLFVLPPSFLLPTMYSDHKADQSNRIYASNFIAASLPICLVLGFLLLVIERAN